MPLILPRNARVDDPTIVDWCLLWRGIDAQWMHRPWGTSFSDAAFRTEELSVILGPPEMTLDQAKAMLQGFSIAEVSAAVARRIGLIIARDPSNRWHGLVYRGDAPGAKITKSQAKQLAQAATLIHVEPEPPVAP